MISLLSFLDDRAGWRIAYGLVVGLLGLAGLAVPASGHAAGKPVVYLTFDDGPSHDDVTDRILETLQYHDIKATFFVLGSRVRMAPHKLQAIVDGGHAVGNHSHSHRALVKLSNSEIRKEIRATADAVRSVTGVEMHCYRPPFGSFNGRVTSIATAEGLAEMLWTVDTLDWQQNQDRQTIRTSLRDARNGSIVLLHDGPVNRESTWEALSTWLAEAVHQYEFAVPAACEPPKARMIHAAMRQDSTFSEIHYTIDQLPEPDAESAAVSDEAVLRWQHEQRQASNQNTVQEIEGNPSDADDAELPANSTAAQIPAASDDETDVKAPATSAVEETVSAIEDGPLKEVVGKLKRYRVIDLY